MHVQPHLKNSNNLHFKHYRPNVMFSSLSLLFERMMYKHFSMPLQQKLYVEQHGFSEKPFNHHSMAPLFQQVYDLPDANKMPMTVCLDLKNLWYHQFQCHTFKIMSNVV